MGTVRVRRTRLLIGVGAALTLFGVLMVASTSIPISQAQFGESYVYLRRHILHGVGVGILAFIIMYRMPLSLLRRVALPVFLAALGLLALVVFSPLGHTVSGATRWLNVAGFTFQPSEIAKLAFVLYCAAWMGKNRRRITQSSSLIPFLLIVGSVSALLALQRDFGTLALLVIVASIMYITAGAKLKSLAIVALVAVIGMGTLIAVEPYRQARVMTFLNPTADTQGAGYQINQALIAIGSGGITGRGLGQGVQKYQYLPESIGDAIFAIVSEELGLLGSVGVLGAFILFIIVGLKIALSARSTFATLTAVGIVSWIGVQALLNIGGVIGSIPFTGIPLPFISFGGTAMVATLAAVGVLANISKNE